MQKFSIKDLSRIEQEIDNEIEFTRQRLSTQMGTECSTRSEAYKVAETAIASAITKQNKLIEAKYLIREIKAKFNAESGINDRTLQIAKLEFTREFLECQVADTSDVRDRTRFNTNQTTYQPGISVEAQDKYRVQVRNLKRAIQRQKDSCNGINSQGKLELDKSLVDVFLEYGLIDA